MIAETLNWAERWRGDFREKVVARYQPLLKQVAWRVWRKLPAQAVLEYEDLVGYGAIGLLAAIERFDPRRGVQFQTFATTKIRGAILDGMRDIDHLSRRLRQQVNCGDADERGHLSLDGVLYRDDEGSTFTLANVLPDGRERSPEDRMAQREDVSQLLSGLSQRDRLLLLLYWSEGLSMRLVGRELGLSESRVCQIHSALLRRLRPEDRGEPKMAAITEALSKSHRHQVSQPLTGEAWADRWRSQIEPDFFLCEEEGLYTVWFRRLGAFEDKVFTSPEAAARAIGAFRVLEHVGGVSVCRLIRDEGPEMRDEG